MIYVTDNGQLYTFHMQHSYNPSDRNFQMKTYNGQNLLQNG